jgi:hypothetical protein
MDEKLNRRLQLAGSAAVAVSYFLPWASIMSPMGSIQLKGLYIDYSWALLVVALAHIAIQFAAANREAFGIPESALKYTTAAHRILPFTLAGFVAWQGAWFAFNVRRSTGATLFGTEIGSMVKAGLDYGYWLGACGALLLVVMVAVSAKQFVKYGVALVGIVAITVGVSFGMTRLDKRNSTIVAGGVSTVTPTTDPSNSQSTAPEFDSSPYLQTVSVKARVYGKDYDASRYRPEIVITPKFRNVSGKMIVGIRGRIAVVDAFGRDVFSFGFRDDDKLAAGTESPGRGGYTFEDNEFEDDDAFSKMYPLVSADNAKYTVKITELAFSDGTILPTGSAPPKQ